MHSLWLFFAFVSNFVRLFPPPFPSWSFSRMPSHSFPSFYWRVLSCIIIIGSCVLLFSAARSSIMSSRYIMKSGAPIADHWKTPVLFPFGFPYSPLYFGDRLVPNCPFLTRLIVPSGNPFFLYIVFHRGVLLMAPMAFDRPMCSIFAFPSACSIYIVPL